jgi:serine/threonine protein kinase/tetratricopeptide (TPR) repeat protein
MLSADQVIDSRYKVLRHLGQGGMGSIYLALDLDLSREVAVKLIHPELLTDEEQRLRFRREAKILSSLSHPNLVVLYQCGFWENHPYLVMEYLQGRTLRAKLHEENRLCVTEACSIVMQLCEAIEVAHNANVIHRDIKPDNVMLTGATERHTTVKVLDFGLARITGEAGDRSQQLTCTGALVGSVHYMSPEQCRGKKAEQRSDIYAIGCVLFETLAGKPPFDADNPVGLMHKHLTAPIPLEELPAELPPGLPGIIEKAMCRDIEKRYQTSGALKADLETVVSGRGIELLPSPSMPPKRKRNTLVAVGIATLLLVASAGVSIRSTQVPPHLPESAMRTTSLFATTAGSKTPRRIGTVRTLLQQAYRELEYMEATPERIGLEELSGLRDTIEPIVELIPQSEPVFKAQAKLTLGRVYCHLFRKTRDKKLRELEGESYLQAIHLLESQNVSGSTRLRAASYARLADLATEQKNRTEAAQYFQTAFDLFCKEQTASPGWDPNLAGGYSRDYGTHLRGKLGKAYQNVGKVALAEKYYKDAVATCLREHGHLTGAACYAIQWHAIMLFSQSRIAELRRLLKDSTTRILADAALERRTEKIAGSLALIADAAAATSQVDLSFQLCEQAVSRVDSTADPTVTSQVLIALKDLKNIAEITHRNDIIVKVDAMFDRVKHFEKLREGLH